MEHAVQTPFRLGVFGALPKQEGIACGQHYSASRESCEAVRFKSQVQCRAAVF